MAGVSLWAAAQEPPPTPAKRVILISVDGLRPDFYLDPESRGIDLPTMTRMMREGLDRLGAMPGAVFGLEAAEGYAFGRRLSGEVITPTGSFGTHGYLPSREKMKTGFLMIGPGVREGVRIPAMRQIDIAPTIALWAEWNLPDTDGLALAGLFEG